MNGVEHVFISVEDRKVIRTALKQRMSHCDVQLRREDITIPAAWFYLEERRRARAAHDGIPL